MGISDQSASDNPSQERCTSEEQPFDAFALVPAFELAKSIDVSWRERERVNWSEAKQLVGLCYKASRALLKSVPEIEMITEYAKTDNEWDSAYVALWPEIIRRSMEQADKFYQIERRGDEWEVVGSTMTGDHKWLASASTRVIAERLVSVLTPSPLDVPDSSGSPIQLLADEMVGAIENSTNGLSGDRMVVSIVLENIIRLKYWEEVLVPVEFDQSLREQLIDVAHDQIDGTRYCSDDSEDVHRGNCTASVVTFL